MSQRIQIAADLREAAEGIDRSLGAAGRDRDRLIEQSSARLRGNVTASSIGATSGSWWLKFLGWLSGGPRRHLDEILAEKYVMETRLSEQLHRHAGRFVRYPVAHRNLTILSERSVEAARDLATAIGRRGGELPTPGPYQDEARTDWERLVADREALRTASDRYVDDAYAVQRDHPDLSALLLGLAERKAGDYRTLLRVMAHLERAVLDRPDEQPDRVDVAGASQGSVSVGAGSQ